MYKETKNNQIVQKGEQPDPLICDFCKRKYYRRDELRFCSREYEIDAAEVSDVCSK